MRGQRALSEISKADRIIITIILFSFDKITI